MADVMQVNSIRFHICLYFLTLSIFESSSFFLYFCWKFTLSILLPQDSHCAFVALWKLRETWEDLRDRAKNCKNPPQPRLTLYNEQRYGLFILAERNFLLIRSCASIRLLPPLPLSAASLPSLPLCAPGCSFACDARVSTNRGRGLRKQWEGMLLSCARVLIVQAVCASSANYPEESKPSPPAPQIILCEI